MQLSFPDVVLPLRPAETRDARRALSTYPDMPTSDLCRYAKHLGSSAELLVDSIFMRLGERAFPVPEHERHDRLLVLPDDTLVRVQVKARHTQTGGDYIFNLKQRSERGATGRGPYEVQDFDLLALVVLPEAAVRFTADWQSRHVIHLSEIPALRRNPRASLDAALARLGHADAIPGGWPTPVDLAA